MYSMKAVILAGGLGIRLREVIHNKPKPMASVRGKPFLQYQIEHLKQYGVDQIILCVAYLAHQIKAYFKEGRDLGVEIKYATEKRPLGTAGALKNAQRYLKENTFLVLNGDTYANIDLFDFMQYHRNKRSKGTIALTRVDQPEEYGTVLLDDNQRIRQFLEKSKIQESYGIINAGVYLLEPEVLDYIPPGIKISLEKEIFPQLLRKSLPLFGYLTSGYFGDIGTPEGYARIQKHLKKVKG